MGRYTVKWGRAADAQRHALKENGVNAVCVNTDDMCMTGAILVVGRVNLEHRS
jgi:hypothetical protein